MPMESLELWRRTGHGEDHELVGLGRTESNGWQQWWFRLQAGLTPTGCLVAFLISGYTQVYFSTITQSSSH